MQAHLFDIMQIAVEPDVLDIPNMPENSANQPIYDALMAVKPPELSKNAWTLKAGVGRSMFTEIRRHGNPGEETLNKLLAAIGMTRADFEARRSTVQSEVRGTGMTGDEARRAWSLPMREARPVPVLGSAFGTDLEGLDGVETTELMLSEVLDHLARPPSLANDDEAYAVTIINDSMAPRFEAGEIAFVSPKAPVSSGDDVVVQLHDPAHNGDDSQLADRVTQVLIKRLVRRTSKFVELRQFNPERTFQVSAERVRRIHRVKGRL